MASVCLQIGGCGGGGDSAAPAQPQQQPAKPAAPSCYSRVQLFGDSTVAQEAPYWQSRWPSTVISNAIGGTTSSQLRNGTDSLNMPWPNSVEAKLIVIGHGTNDGTSFYPATPIATYKDNLRAFAAAPGVRTIFMTPLPNTDPARMDTIPAYAQAMRDVAKELGVSVIDREACWKARADWPTMLYDGTHATPDAREWTVQNCAAPVIEPLLCPKG